MNNSGSSIRLAVDIGGTFTDAVLEVNSQRFTAKLLTTPSAPEQAVLASSRMVLEEAAASGEVRHQLELTLSSAQKVLKKAGVSFKDVDVFVHGTTLATNAIIERKGARTALIASEGFRDVLEIGDEGRYDQYDIFIDKPKHLVPRHLRFTVPERVNVQGRVLLPLDENAVRAVAAELNTRQLQSVAVALIHSYANDFHERRIREILAEECPSLRVTLSSQACPEMREYERTSTTVVNAYVQPLMAGYLERLKELFCREGYAAPIHLMTSGGSLMSLEAALLFPIRLVESGPAGGAILAAQVAAERNERKVLSFDMGGTTAKICLIRDFKPFKGRTFEVDRAARFQKGSGLPVRVPVIEMIEIGAGGGSIARVDALKRITVGPDSAGADPGPACYGRGGAEPTVTDSDVLLGKIDPQHFAGGTFRLLPEKSVDAIRDAVAKPLSLSVEDAAYGVAEIVEENMSNAARVHAVERGETVSEYTLVAFGGAAPLHAARLAEKLGINRIVVPPDAGVGSAVGFLRAPAAYELVRSKFMRLDRFDAAAVTALLTEMSDEARELTSSAAYGRPLFEKRVAYMRYSGQGHEVAVVLPNRPLKNEDVPELISSFEREYRQLFERHIPNASIEVLSWSVIISTGDAQPSLLPQVSAVAAPEPVGINSVFDAQAKKSIRVPAFRRSDLRPGATVEGPAIIVEDNTSTFVTGTFRAMVDGGGLVLTRKHKDGETK
jgi:N-methylhydantoinase A